MPEDTATETTFGRLLDRWRAAEDGRCDASFARLLDISPAMVSRARSGAVRLDTRTLAAACVALGANREEALLIYAEARQGLPPVLGGTVTLSAEV